MAAFLGVKRRWESVLSIGSHQAETDIQRGARRIFVGYLFFSAVIRLWFGFITFSEGDSVTGVVLLTVSAVSVIALAVLRARPRWFVGVVSLMLIVLLLDPLVETVAQGGLVPSGMVILHGTVAVVGALITLGVRAAFWWVLAYVFTVVAAVVLPNWIEPSHLDAGEDLVTAINVIVATTFVFAGMAYFVRQRDRFQRESDDLLQERPSLSTCGGHQSARSRTIIGMRRSVLVSYPANRSMIAKSLAYSTSRSGPSSMIVTLAEVWATGQATVPSLMLPPGRV